MWHLWDAVPINTPNQASRSNAAIGLGKVGWIIEWAALLWTSALQFRKWTTVDQGSPSPGTPMLLFRTSTNAGLSTLFVLPPCDLCCVGYIGSFRQCSYRAAFLGIGCSFGYSWKVLTGCNQFVCSQKWGEFQWWEHTTTCASLDVCAGLLMG